MANQRNYTNISQEVKDEISERVNSQMIRFEDFMDHQNFTIRKKFMKTKENLREAREGREIAWIERDMREEHLNNRNGRLREENRKLVEDHAKWEVECIKKMDARKRERDQARRERDQARREKEQLRREKEQLRREKEQLRLEKEEVKRERNEAWEELENLREVLESESIQEETSSEEESDESRFGQEILENVLEEDDFEMVVAGWAHMLATDMEGALALEVLSLVE